MGIRIGGPLRLTPDAFERVVDALTDAFSDRSEFERLARSINKRLEEVVSPTATNLAIAQALIEVAEKEDAIDRLITGAKKQNPSNRRLAATVVANLEEAASTLQVVERGVGASAFKQRLVEALGYLDTPGRAGLAGSEFDALLRVGSDPELETLFLALLGTVRADATDEAVAELGSVISELLRRRIGAAKRPNSVRVDLARAQLGRIDLSGLDLHQSDLAFADLRHADLTNTNLWRSRAYGVNVTKASLSQSNLEEVRWHAAVAREARFHDCRMVSAFFKDADLTGAEFQRSRLQGAHFERADLSGTRFEQANLSDAYFARAIVDASTVKSIARAANWDKAHFDPHTRTQIIGVASR